MSNLKDIRWKQRFSNFEKSYKILEKYIHINPANELERAGLIQFFETTFELSWKVLKDYLEAQDFLLNSPRETIKKAFQIGFIDNGHVWLAALSDRNLTVHTYDEEISVKMTATIQHDYFPEIQKVYEKLLKEVD